MNYLTFNENHCADGDRSDVGHIQGPANPGKLPNPIIRNKEQGCTSAVIEESGTTTSMEVSKEVCMPLTACELKNRRWNWLVRSRHEPQCLFCQIWYPTLINNQYLCQFGPAARKRNGCTKGPWLITRAITPSKVSKYWKYRQFYLDNKPPFRLFPPVLPRKPWFALCQPFEFFLEEIGFCPDPNWAIGSVGFIGSLPQLKGFDGLSFINENEVLLKQTPHCAYRYKPDDDFKPAAEVQYLC